jgi:phenylalanyl-tRNA synthetase alpha chain
MNAADLKKDLLDKIHAANDTQNLEEVRVSALGKKGAITDLMKSLGKMTPEERKTEGAALNKMKDEIASALEARQAELKRVEMAVQLEKEKIDITLPIRPQRKGTIHPITQTMDEMIAIFADMGFSVADGPDIEDDFHNFTALNFPPKHPAREMQDTFFLPDVEGKEGDEAKRLLRTHTSTCQIRAMVKEGAPLRKIVMGRVYRAEAMDTTHSAMFHQIEGIMIDKTTHMGHLKGIMKTFSEKFFDVDDLPIRFRPSFFPFTEPSAEIDIGCKKTREEIKIGGGDDWLEIGGCGMVHPNVLKNVGVDPDEYQGFAFGMGLERMAMLKYGITDVRSFYEGDVRWNAHYGTDPLNIPNLATGL